MKGKIFLLGTACFVAGIAVYHLLDNIQTRKFMKEFEDAEEDFEKEETEKHQETTEKTNIEEEEIK